MLEHIYIEEEKKEKIVDVLHEHMLHKFIIFPFYFSPIDSQNLGISFLIGCDKQHYFIFHSDINFEDDLDGGRTNKLPISENNFFTAIYKKGVYLADNLDECCDLMKESLTDFFMEQFNEEKTVDLNFLKEFFKNVYKDYTSDEYLMMMQRKEIVKSYYTMQESIPINEGFLPKKHTRKKI